MPEETTDAPNLPSSSADSPHIPSTDVPEDPSAAASAEIFAAMDGSTIAQAEADEGDASGEDEAAAGEGAPGEAAASE